MNFSMSFQTYHTTTTQLQPQPQNNQKLLFKNNDNNPNTTSFSLSRPFSSEKKLNDHQSLASQICGLIPQEDTNPHLFQPQFYLYCDLCLAFWRGREGEKRARNPKEKEKKEKKRTEKRKERKTHQIHKTGLTHAFQGSKFGNSTPLSSLQAVYQYYLPKLDHLGTLFFFLGHLCNKFSPKPHGKYW